MGLYFLGISVKYREERCFHGYGVEVTVFIIAFKSRIIVAIKDL